MSKSICINLNEVSFNVDVDDSGRLRIPKSIRKELGIEPWDEMTVSYDKSNKIITIQPSAYVRNFVPKESLGKQKTSKVKLRINEAEQKYNSAVTSINSSKLPALFSKVKFEPDTINLDYGGGKFDNVTDYLANTYKCTNLVYDKYNRSSSHNADVLKQVKANKGADTVTCSNVLNVIAEPEVRLEVIKDLKKYLKNDGTCYITVYTGDGSGEGKANEKRQSYQTNMKLDDYIPEVSKVFSSVTKSKGMLVCKK